MTSVSVSPWRMKCSVTVAESLRVRPLRRVQPSFRCVVVTTRMSPSHLPVEKPIAVCMRVLGRMRAAVHPDRPLGAPREMMRVDGDELLRRRVALFPDAQAGEARHVVGRVHAALVLGQRDERGVPGVGAGADGVVDRQARVVAELGARQTVGPVLVQDAEVVPHARQVRLRRRGNSREHDAGGKRSTGPLEHAHSSELAEKTELADCNRRRRAVNRRVWYG